MACPGENLSTRYRGLAALAGCLVSALVGFGLPAAAGATTTCHRVAATYGSDSNPGTHAQPVRTPKRLVATLAAGQTGCLRGGTYTFTTETVKVDRPDVTLTSYPRERAKLVGRLWIAGGAVGAKILNLDLDGRNSSNLPSPTVTANNTVWRGNDLTNGHTAAICLHLGSGSYGDANRTLVEGNRIHNCGRLPAANHHHGIYVLHADDSVIRDNVIYDNADRGINLYPDARRVRITANVIDGNGEGVMFAGDGSSASTDNVVTGNIISNSKVRFNVEAYWSSTVGSGNTAQRNCVFASNPRSSYYNARGGIAKEWGFNATQNVIADPLYVNRAGRDFRLQAGSRCQGYGPGSAVAKRP